MKATSLGEFLQKRRKEEGLSLRTLAKRVRVSPPFISQVERDRAYPSDALLHRIAEHLQVDVTTLKALDTRIPFDDLRRMVDRSPDFRRALHHCMTDVTAGDLSLEKLAAHMLGVSRKGRSTS
jgi:transcriptional regulator with XRE-family HTH domain